MKRNLLILAIVVTAVAIMIFGGQFLARRGPQSGALSGGKVVGQKAPDFELTSIPDGRTVRLSDYRGKAVLLNFWATWCGPCKIEMPWFVDFQNQYGPQGLEIVGVAMEDTGDETVDAFAKKMGVNYTILRGKNAVGDAYGGVLGLPTTYYIDRNGIIIERHIGLAGRGDIEARIQKALGTDAPAANPAASLQNSKEGEAAPAGATR